MTIKRLDHVSVVVDDLEPAIAFFNALGMTIEGKMPIEGSWVDRVNGIEGVQVDIVMMRTPDGHGKLELTKFRNPRLVEIEPAIAPPNALGLRSVMFTVESVDDTVARLREIGGQLIGEVTQYEDKYRLCYLRGPAGIIVGPGRRTLLNSARPSVMPQGGNGLQPRVAASATLGDQRNLSSTAMRLCLLGAFFSDKMTQPRCG